MHTPYTLTHTHTLSLSLSLIQTYSLTLSSSHPLSLTSSSLSLSLLHTHTRLTRSFGKFAMSVKDGVRSSTSNAYLRPAMDRPNLTVITDTSVR